MWAAIACLLALAVLIASQGQNDRRALRAACKADLAAARAAAYEALITPDRDW